MKNISVFCSSSTGTDPIFMDQAFQLGKTLAEKKQDSYTEEQK